MISSNHFNVTNIMTYYLSLATPVILASVIAKLQQDPFSLRSVLGSNIHPFIHQNSRIHISKVYNNNFVNLIIPVETNSKHISNELHRNIPSGIHSGFAAVRQ